MRESDKAGLTHNKLYYEKVTCMQLLKSEKYVIILFIIMLTILHLWIPASISLFYSHFIKQIHSLYILVLNYADVFS